MLKQYDYAMLYRTKPDIKIFYNEAQKKFKEKGFIGPIFVHLDYMIVAAIDGHIVPGPFWQLLATTRGV
jgi:hypothetical protein